MEIIENYTFTRSYRTDYPWTEWMDGEPRKATRGIDFNCKPESFQTLLYREAKARGLKVHVKREDNAVIFQTYVQ